MQPNWQVDAHLEVQVPMRDGVNLSTDVYLPKAAGPFPTVLMRTPYSNNMDVYIRKARGLANDGYACVVQDVRGRWDSDGEFYPQAAERNDGYDTQEWIGSQAWSSGKIGMSGRSYLGAVQWLSAPLRSRYLTCLAPQSANSNPLGDLVRPGGAFQLGVLVTWGMRTTTRTSQSIAYENFTETFNTLPLIDLAKRAGRPLPFWSDWLQRPSDDPFWAEISTTTRWDQISVPAFNMGGWYDLYSAQAFRHFNGLRQQGRTPEARQSKLLVGPWPHHLGTDLSTSPRTGDIDFGAHSAISMDSVERRWFDYWLKGIANGIVDEPPLRLFIMGINEWRDEHEWPLARTDWQGWCLHSGGGAQSARGDGTLSLVPPADEPADTFEYDPRYPVQTVGGANCCSPEVVPWGPYDQRPVESRSDVLCYTSDPLETDVEVTGPVKLVLHAATDGLDTDWTAKLVDVAPSGYAMNLCDGIIRARYRDGLTNPGLLTPDEVYEYEIDMGVTGNVFRRGHRIRLDVSSSNFPRFDRNLNTGKDLTTDADVRVALQTVLHSTAHQSRLVLPVIPSTN